MPKSSSAARPSSASSSGRRLRIIHCLSKRDEWSGPATRIGLVGTANPIAIKPGVGGVGGSVKQIFPEEGELVKFDQVLIVIRADQRDRQP